MPIEPETLDWLQEIYNTCGPFASDVELAEVFMDARLAAWRSNLPLSDGRTDRIDAVINYLHDKVSTEPDSDTPTPARHALVLLTQVLAERTDAADACRPALRSAAQRLEEELSPIESATGDEVTFRLPSVPEINASSLLDHLILNMHITMRAYRGFAMILVILGLLIAGMGFLLPSPLLPAPFRPWIGVGGLFISSLSVLQFREIVHRKEKADLLRAIKKRLLDLQQNPAYHADSERVDAQVWQVVEIAAVPES
ncbi:MAG: hypothetical protein P1S60_17130 [Anaerolineae bacterium]|nr:hypothetical protein [Anaerolineae bacterium]